MAGDSFGVLYRVTSFGESHGPALGGVVEGCPPGLELSADDLQRDLDRLIREEQSVIRHYIKLGNWPHKRVNMFVFENLQPLVAQIKSTTELPLDSV